MEEQQEKSYHQKKYIWYILTLSLFNYFGATAWDVIFPDIVTRANGTVSLWGYAYAAFNITKFIFQIPNANLSDKIGRSKVISLCLFLFGIGSTLVLWAYEPWILILARALQGAGAVSAVFLAAISDYSKGKDKGMIVAGRNLSQTLGWILGMMAGGIVAEYFGLRVAIILCVLIGFIGGGIAFFLVDEGDKKNIVESGSNSNSEDPQ